MKICRRLFQYTVLVFPRRIFRASRKAKFRTGPIRLRFEPAVLQIEAYIIITVSMCSVQGLSRVSLWKGTANQNGTAVA
jgi:hypothetical protein